MTKTKYELLKVNEKEFLEIVFGELLFVTDSEYAQKIATAIYDDVAQNICDSADLEHWSIDDIRIGIGRALMKSLGIQE
jgi:hypothetical protein